MLILHLLAIDSQSSNEIIKGGKLEILFEMLDERMFASSPKLFFSRNSKVSLKSSKKSGTLGSSSVCLRDSPSYITKTDLERNSEWKLESLALKSWEH